MINEPQSHCARSQDAIVVTVLCIVLLCAPLTGDATAIQKRKAIASTTQYQRWQRSFFPEIHARARLSKLSNLQSSSLPKDDLELRIWIGFGPAALEGFVLKRQGTDWTAMHLRSTSPHLVRVDAPKKLAAPKSGWEPFWQRLTGEGVLTLPDSGGGFSYTDSEAVVVELREGESYRTYMYDIPSETADAKRMKSIVQTIRDEFNVPR